MFMTKVCGCESVIEGRNGVTQHPGKEAIHGGVGLTLFFAVKPVSCVFLDPKDLAPLQCLDGVRCCLILH